MNRLYTVFGIAMLGCTLVTGPLQADLSEALSEDNLEKRSDKALKNADRAMQDLSNFYKEGDMKKVEAALGEVAESVELAFKSLLDSGKTPRKSKYFKRAEIQTRSIAGSLEEIGKQMSVFDREPVEKLQRRVHEIHEDLLMKIMSKK